MHILIGLILVAVLCGAFVLGASIRENESAPPEPQSHPVRPATNRPPGEVAEYRRPVEVPRTDKAHRLRPYQLRGSTEAAQRPGDE
ncbi:DUF6479 family protein [Streptomyces sp. NPDC087908]|nr:DUF6479 family protein [Streptomyces sp. adm13(2018)]TXS15783.1 hypothetical protein EAO70_15515 [Streptomyces sp. adm13(2018)]